MPITVRGTLVAAVLISFAAVAPAQIVISPNEDVTFKLGIQGQVWADTTQSATGTGYANNLYLRRLRIIAGGDIGHDLSFHEKLPRLFPHVDARAWFVGNDALIAATAFRNGTLQGAYLMLALRSLGLDVGPMSGFDPAQVDAAFFAGTPIKSNFLVNIGYGDPAKLFPRSPRLDFAEIAQLV